MKKIIQLTIIMLMTAGCDPNGALAGLTEATLRAELDECVNISNPSNVKAIACQNFQRECRRRRDEDGRFRDC